MKLFKILLILVLLGGIITTGYFTCIKKQNKKIKSLEEKISLLKEEQTPVRFKIIEKKDGHIYLTIKFYNADNKEINKEDFVVPGKELSFDFQVIEIKDRYVAFPSKLFSNVTPASKGIKLYHLYDVDGFPAIFQSKELNPSLKGGLEEVFQQVKNEQTDSLDNSFGNMVHDIKSFKSFVPETVYSIVTHTKGGIEIVEE